MSVWFISNEEVRYNFMMSFKTIALSCLAMAPWGVYGGACKPRTTDTTIILSSMTTVSSEASQATEPTSTLPSDIQTTISSEAPSTTTSSAPCPAWTPITPYSADKICAKPVSYDHSTNNPYYLKSELRQNINECAKFCGDTEDCVSFYAENYQPGTGAPIFKICFLFKGYEEEIGFSEGQSDNRAFWEQGCFQCVRNTVEPTAP
ncbi:unnamed protein product [Fusarium graminearum]|nr:unnamed protein product [Fusarium graminearum]